MSQVSILTVCTANICRSPSAATLLRRALTPRLPDLVVTSAGTEAVNGRPACDLSSALIGQYIATRYPTGPQATDTAHHRSHLVTDSDIATADLILALDRSHRSALAVMSPRSRCRTFTLRQAAAAAEVVGRTVSNGSLPEGAPPLPQEHAHRFRWWVDELDAHRGGTAPAAAPNANPMVFDPLDVPDPHVVGYQYHPSAIELIEQGVASLAKSLAAVLDFNTFTASAYTHGANDSWGA